MDNIIDKQSSSHYQWADNCDSWVLVNTPGLSVKLEKMPADTKEKLHFHSNAQQFFFVLKGKAAFYHNDKKETIESQQGFLAIPITRHYIANETQEALEFLVISQPDATNDRINCE